MTHVVLRCIVLSIYKALLSAWASRKLAQCEHPAEKRQNFRWKKYEDGGVDWRGKSIP